MKNLNLSAILLSLLLFFTIHLASAQGTVHVIHYADTKGIGGIAQSCKEGVNFVHYEIVEGIRQYSGMEVEYYLVTGDKFKQGNMASHLRNIPSGTYDVILFFYEGHGSSSGNDWPSLSFTGFTGGASLDYTEAYRILKAKDHRLLLMFANACNNISGSNSSGHRRGAAFSMQEAKAQRYQELFQNYSGNLLMSSSKKGQLSRAIQGELSYFFGAFREAFRSAVNSDSEASWETIKSKIADKTTSYASEDGYTQQPIHYMDIQKVSTQPVRTIPGEPSHTTYSWEDLERVKRNGKWGYIDKKGNTRISLIYDWAYSFREGLAAVEKNGKYGYIDKNGDTRISFIYDHALWFREGLARVQKNGKWGFIDKNGDTRISFIYGSAKEFSKGLAAVEKNEKWGFIDKKGNTRISFIYDDAGHFSEGLASVGKNGKCGFIDKKGNTRISFIYDHALWFREGLASVKKNGKYGFIDKNGDTRISFIYDSAFWFNDGLAEVKKNGKEYYINKSGTCVKDCD